MRSDRRLDAGGILHAEQVPIGPRDTVGDVCAALNRVQRRVLPAVVRAVLAGDEGTPQDEAAATYACTRIPDDGDIDWSRPTAEIDRLVRALAPPFPGALTWLGLDFVGVVEAEPAPDTARWEGRVVRVDRAAGTVDVLTGELRLRRLARGRRRAGARRRPGPFGPRHPRAAHRRSRPAAARTRGLTLTSPAPPLAP